jgi:hypothetical protein
LHERADHLRSGDPADTIFDIQKGKVKLTVPYRVTRCDVASISRPLRRRHRLIHEISQALKNEGLLDPNARFERMDQLLDGLEKTSDHLAQTLNLPPVDVHGLRREWEKLKEELQGIPPKNLPALVPGPNLDRTAADGNNAEPLRLHHLILDGGFHDRACPREPALASPSRPFGRAAHGDSRWNSPSGPLLTNSRRDHQNRLSRVLDTRIPALSPCRSGTIRARA